MRTLAARSRSSSLRWTACSGHQADGLPKDIRHVALSVATRAEVLEWKRRLQKHRIDFWEEIHGPGELSVYLSDPNGVLIEIDYHPPATKAVALGAALDVVREWTSARGQPGV